MTAQQALVDEFPLGFAPILDRIDATIFVLDTDGDVVHWNKAAEELTGESLADARAKEVAGQAFYHDGRRAKTLADKVLDKTVRNCRRASDIMQSMLALANGQAQERENTDLRALVEEVFTCLCRDFSKDGVRVDVEIAEGMRLRCVPVQIQQVLMNLILNAREAMLPGGGLLQIAAESDGSWTRLTVSDTGAGISPEDQKNIFRPFFTTKAQAGRPAVPSGSGVGLAFCKRIIDAHNGEIRVDSELGRGTTFTIRLPHS